MASCDLPQRFSSRRVVSQADWDKLQHEFLDCFDGANQRCEPDWMHAARLLREYPRLIHVQPRGRWPALHQAISMANVDAVRFFLGFGADPNLTACHAGQDPMTPKELAEQLRDQVHKKHPSHEEIFESNTWGQSTPKRKNIYDEIVRLLSDAKIKPLTPRHDAIAHSYIVAMSTGDLNDDAKEELRDQWLLLDPTMSLIEDVVEKVNEHYDRAMQDCIRKLDFGLFPTILQALRLNAPVHQLLSFAGHADTSPSLGALICWPFRVCAQDVRHALDDLTPPETVEVALPRLSSVLANLLPLWDGAETRLAFQTLAMKRSWSSWSDIRSMDRADIVAWFPLTLYGTMILCAVFSYFAGIYIAYEALNTVYTVVFGSGFRVRLCSTIWLGGMVWLGGVGRAYCDAMQPRIPMLTVRLHRFLISKGKLLHTDYTPCKDFKRYDDDKFNEGGNFARNTDARTPTKRRGDDVSNQEDVAANPSDIAPEAPKRCRCTPTPPDSHLHCD